MIKWGERVCEKVGRERFLKGMTGVLAPFIYLVLQEHNFFMKLNLSLIKKKEKEATLRCCVSMLYEHILQLSNGLAYIKMSHRKIKGTFQMFPILKV